MENEKLIDEFIQREKLKNINVHRIVKDRNRLYRILKSLGTDFVKVTGIELERTVDLLTEELSVTSYNDYVNLCRKFFKFLCEEGKIVQNPASVFQYKKEERRKHLGVFTEEEVKKLIKAIPDDTILGIRDRAVVEILYSTAIRAGELVNLNIGDVDFRSCEIRIYNGKGGVDRVVPVGAHAIEAMEKYFAIRNNFINDKTDREALILSMSKRRMTQEMMRDRIKEYKKKAGITSTGTLHALRHSCATHMLKHGAKLPELARLLGHADLSHMQIYTHLAFDDVKEAHMKSIPGK